MNNLNDEKSDVVSVILENHDLLDVFADTLKETEIEPVMKKEDEFFLITFSENSLSKIQKVKFYLWKKIKDFLEILSNKAQVLAVLSEYHLKNEIKKIQRR
jgi:hypothetical protein